MTKVIVGSPVWSLNGVNIFSANLVRGLLSAGVPSRILLTGVTYKERKPMPLPPDVPVEQLRISRFATWKSRWRALVDLLESEAPCIWLPNHDFRHSCVSSALSARVGVVGIVHSDDPQHYEHARLRGRTWNATVAVSNAIASRVRESGSVDDSRLCVIPYGVPASVTPSQRANDKDLRIIYTGRLESDQKRVTDLPAIASALQRLGVRFTLRIVGDGPERPTLEREISARGLRSRVEIVAPVGNERVLEMCAECDAFILPSAFEGMPISLLEAMGQGCVPFVTDIASGIPELIENGRNGFIVPVGDIEGFAARLAEFAHSPAMRERMRVEARSTIDRGGYRIDVMTARYAELFDRVSGEMEAGTFVRAGAGAITPLPLPMRERIAAPLWWLRPSMRKQHNPATWKQQR